jgi:hypothetical protein
VEREESLLVRSSNVVNNHVTRKFDNEKERRVKQELRTRTVEVRELSCNFDKEQVGKVPALGESIWRSI